MIKTTEELVAEFRQKLQRRLEEPPTHGEDMAECLERANGVVARMLEEEVILPDAKITAKPNGRGYDVEFTLAPFDLKGAVV